MTNEERLDYAKKNYPAGTKYIYMNHYGEEDTAQSIVEGTGRFRIDDGDIDGGPGWLYSKKANKWTTIVEKVVEEPSEEYILI